jgi:hypothetical protein
VLQPITGQLGSPPAANPAPAAEPAAEQGLVEKAKSKLEAVLKTDKPAVQEME